jgi:MFS family permease
MDTKKVPEGYLFSKGYTYYVFALLCLLMLFDFADRMIISSLLPLIKAEWKLTDAQSGGLVSAVYWCMFIFVIPISILVDRWSRRKAAALMSTLWSIACAAGAFVTGYRHRGSRLCSSRRNHDYRSVSGEKTGGDDRRVQRFHLYRDGCRYDGRSVHRRPLGLASRFWRRGPAGFDHRHIDVFRQRI